MDEGKRKTAEGFCFFDKTRKCDSTCMAWLEPDWIDLNFNDKKDADEPELIPCRIIRALEAISEDEQKPGP